MQTTSDPELVSRLRFALARSARRLRQEAGTGLSPSLTAALATVERCGPLTPSELADLERVARPTITRVLTRLEEAGLMEPAGAAAIAAAKQTGMWTLMDDVEDCIVPDDLAAAFDRNPGAREHWESWSASAQKLILTWIVLAKRPETRAVRISTTAEKAAQGIKAQ